MTETLHIVRKDLKHLRWLLLVWLALLIARVGFWSLGVTPSSDQGYGFLLQRSTGTVESLLLLVLAFIAARLVHEEPLVGWNAFWFTRPYSRRALLAAKLLLAAAVFIALPLVSDVATMAMYHVGPRAQFEASTTFIIGYVTWMLLAMAMATLTPSLGAFVLATVATFTVLSLVTMAIATASVYLREPTTMTAVFAGINPRPGLVATLLVSAAMVAVIILQYRYRQWRPAAGLAASGIAASIAIPWLPFGGPVQIDPGTWARDPSVSVVLGRDSRTRNAFRDGALKRLVYAPVRLTGAPRNFDVGSYAIVDSTVTLPDGMAVSSRVRDSISAPSPDPEWHGSFTIKRGVLGDVTLIPGANEGDVQYWPAVISLSGQQYERLRGMSVRLNATMVFPVNSMRRRAILPLEPGAAHGDGLSRVEVIRTERSTDGLTVTVRRWRAYSPLGRGQVLAAHSFALYSPSRREALTPIKRTELPTPAGTQNVSGAFPVLSLMGAMSGGLRHGGLLMNAEEYLFPDRIERPGSARSFDASWFDGASLAVVETAFAGTVTRSVTIDDFPIPVE